MLQNTLDDMQEICVALIAGVVASLLQQKHNSMKAMTLRAISAGFTGYIVAKLCHVANASEDLTTAISGIAGWIGAESVFAALQRKLENQIGVRENER